jgi:hypothetical protein
MPKFKPFLVIGLIVLLGVVAALGAFAASSARVTVASNSGPGLTVPQANMPMDTNFKAKPAVGANSTSNVAFANIKVNPDSSNEAQNEPFVAVDPNNANHIVVGANSWLVGGGHFEVFAYVSFDKGKTWASSQPYIDRNASRINAADPTVSFGPDGKVYYGFVALTPATGAVAVSTSLDGGLTWSSQNWVTSFSDSADKPAIAAGNGKLYVFYQNQSLLWTSSANGGATWSAAKTIEFGGRNAAPVVDRNGNVSVFYNTDNAIKMSSITRPSFSTTVQVSNAVALQGRPTHYRAGVYPAAAVTPNGTFYVAWADGRNAGHGNDILYSRSTNGQVWSAPAVLNTDNSSADQLMPSLAVGSDNSVTVAWLDNRNDPANVNYDVYMARSVNGVNFGANQRVTSISSNPNNDPRTQGSLIGDYFAMASSGTSVYTAWTDTRNNNEDIYFAPLSASNN